MSTTFVSIAALVLLVVAVGATVAFLSLLVTYYREHAEVVRLRAFVQIRADLGDDDAVRALGDY